MTIAPVKPVRTQGYQQHQGAGAEYIPNQPTAAELGLAADIRTPFVGSMLLNAQMERRNAVAENNRMADQAAEQQAQQFEKSLELERLKAAYGTFDTPYGGIVAREQGLDPGRLDTIEKQQADAANAAIFGTQAQGLGNISQAGGDVGAAAAKLPGQDGVSYGPTPAERASTADNATSLDVARIGANASMYGARVGADATRAGKGPEYTVEMPPTQQSTHPNIQGKFHSLEEAQRFAAQQAQATGAMQSGERPLNGQEQQAWIAAIDDQITAAGGQRQGLPRRRPDGTTVVSVKDANGNVSDVPVNIAPQAP
jgi:hypothetical protein